MSFNKEQLKKKIIYRASYRGTKEMDKLILGFVQKIINNLNFSSLEALDDFVNMDDETLISIQKNESSKNINDPEMLSLIKKFQDFKL
tara:strand:+ start:259 stop:522 length:264 start_codon:yes stop_codon:yes gene_type:complete